jgi:hypothetical protein
MIEDAIKKLYFDYYYLAVYRHKDVIHGFKIVYLNDEHKLHIQDWLKQNYDKLSDEYKHLVKL